MEKPILFSGPMVQAILDDCKTQTRRVVTRKDFGGSMLCDAALKNVAISPYGAVGDRLWVRETFCDTGCMRAVYRASTDEGRKQWPPGASRMVCGSMELDQCFAGISLECKSASVGHLVPTHHVKYFH